MMHYVYNLKYEVMGFFVGKRVQKPVEKAKRGKAEYVTVATETPVLDDAEVTNDTVAVEAKQEEKPVRKRAIRRKKGGG